MKNNKIKALSFFSGAMGLDIGLEKAGIEVILACESEKFIRETIKLNRPNLKVLEDINNYSVDVKITDNLEMIPWWNIISLSIIFC